MVKKKRRRIKNKKLIFKRPIFWIIVLFLIIIFLLLYLFLFFSKIQVNSVIAGGNYSVLSEDIENIAWNNINKKIITLGNWNLVSKSIFLAGSEIIVKNILNKFPQIESAKVSKEFPQTIVLQIKERVPFAAFCQTDDKKCFYIDENGIIFEVLEQIPKDTSIIRQLREDQEVFAGEKVVEKNIMDIINNVKRSLKDNFQIDVKEAIISNPSRLNIETSENWQIYLNTDLESDLQIVKMNLLLRDEIPASGRKGLQYIDLRFKDRAYYK